MAESKSIGDFLGADTPSNWGKWGPDDELGCLNYLDAGQVLMRQGDVGELLGQEGHRPGRPRWIPGRGAVVAAAQEQGGGGDEGCREPALDPGHHAWR